MVEPRSNPFVSVITINWNGQRFLEKLLPILGNQTYPHNKYEIIVLDNNSTQDESVSYIKQHFPNIKLIENSKNDGFAKGCNLAMQQARGDYFVLINNDTAPHADWLEKLVECAEQQPHTGAVVSKVLFANRGKGNIINNAGSLLFPDRPWPVEEIGANQPDGPEYDKPREITALCGTSLLLSREMLKSIGLFDESYFMYFEDADLSWRGQEAGWKFYYCPSSVVLHEHSGSSTEHSDFWTFYVTRNRLLIMYKHARFGLAARVYAGFIKEFFVLPVLRGLAGHQRRHQLRTVKLAFKINFSFWLHLGSTMLRRWHVLREARL